MAVATVSGNCGFRRLASAFSANAPYTMAGWIWYSAATTGACGVGSSSGTLNGADVADFVSGGNIRSRTYSDAGATLGTGVNTAAATGAWRYVALVRESATSLRVFVDTAWESSPLTADTSGRSASSTNFAIGQSIATTFFMSGKLASWKIWTAALTDTQLLTEKQYRNPQSNIGSVWAVYKFLDNATSVDDTSGNSRTLAKNGTWTDDTDPAAILGDDPSPSNAPRSMFYHNFGMR
jgi:hypothetical protein